MTPAELRMATRSQAEIDSDVREKLGFTKRYTQYLGSLGAGADKTVWNDATKQYIQVPTVSAKQYAPIDAMKQGAKLRADAQAYYSPKPNINRPSYDPRFIDYVVKAEGYGPQSTSQQSTSQQQGAPAQSPQGGGVGGVSGIEFVWSGGGPGTRVGTPSGRQGTMDPLYDPKYRFWDKGIPSRFYDAVDPNFDPSKPRAGFGDQLQRERRARARWIAAMTDQEYSFYRRSLGQGAGSSGQDADAMRQAAKNPPAPKEEYGDPSKGQPGPIGLRGEAANSKAASTHYMGGSNSFNEFTGRYENGLIPRGGKPEDSIYRPGSKTRQQSATGLGRTTTARKLPTRARRSRMSRMSMV